MEDRVFGHGSPEQARRRRIRVGSVVVVAGLVLTAGLGVSYARGLQWHHDECQARLRQAQFAPTSPALDAADRCYRRLRRMNPFSRTGVQGRDVVRRLRAGEAVERSEIEALEPAAN